MTDYNFLMESRLSPAQSQVLNNLIRIAHAEELNLYLVGGAVRDMTFGRTAVRNLDFALEGDIQKILRHMRLGKAAAKKQGKRVPGGDLTAAEVSRSEILPRQRVARIWFANGTRAEIGQCRQETYTSANRPPTITPATIFEDLKRRDFALNAMAISLHPNSRGLLLDPKNGVSDIERGEIRALHPRTFIEDPVRIYRLLRLCFRFDFKPEEKTQRRLEAALEQRVWTNLSAESQANELRAVLHEDAPDRVLKVYQQHGILAGLDRNLAKVPYDRFRKVHGVARKLPGADPFLLHFNCLVGKMSGPVKKRLAQKILGDAKTTKFALSLESETKKVARVLGSAKCARPSQAYKLLSAQPRPLLLFLLAYHPQAKIQSRVKHFLVKAPEVRARLPRQELMALGVKHGPAFEKIIERIFVDQLDGKLRSHSQLEKELRALAGIKEPVAKPPRPKPVRPKVPQSKPQKKQPKKAPQPPQPKAAKPQPKKTVKPPKPKKATKAQSSKRQKTDKPLKSKAPRRLLKKKISKPDPKTKRKTGRRK